MRWKANTFQDKLKEDIKLIKESNNDIRGQDLKYVSINKGTV